MMEFDAPIPGQSLTTPPKGFPWERPQEIVDPELAIQYHLEKLSRPESIEGILDALEIMEVDVATLTKGYLRVQVANGIHSIDVSLLVAPVIHEFIKQVATAADLDFDEGIIDKKKKNLAQKKREEERAKKVIKGLDMNPKELIKESKSVSREAPEMASMEEGSAPMKAPSKGLMSKEGI